MTSANSQPSPARLEARIAPEVKALIQKAADLEGCTLTDFVTRSVRSAAYETIERHQTLKLSIEDSEAFVNAILNPPEPNEALKSAAQQYKKIMSI